MPKNWEFVLAAYLIWGTAVAVYIVWLAAKRRGVERALRQLRQRADA